MTKFFSIVMFGALVVVSISAQVRPRSRPTPAPLKTPAVPAAADSKDAANGQIVGRTYTNRKFRFEVTFPDSWLIPGDDFDDYMKKQGYDLTLKAPDSISGVNKAAVDQALKKVRVLLTAYRSLPGSTNNAIVRISTEDLSLEPQIKDAVDYFDAIRSTYAKMKLPPDFFYSDTQAEQLGANQFAFLDSSSAAGKKRMYAVVRAGFAVMFTLSYSNDQDLETLRQVLSSGKFDLK